MDGQAELTGMAG